MFLGKDFLKNVGSWHLITKQGQLVYYITNTPRHVRDRNTRTHVAITVPTLLAWIMAKQVACQLIEQTVKLAKESFMTQHGLNTLTTAGGLFLAHLEHNGS